MNDPMKPVLCLAVSILLAACSSPPLVKQPPEWSYQKDAVRIRVASDPQLNLYRKKAHSLIVCLYHLRDLGAFNQLNEEREGLARLLECGRFDPSVTYAKRMVVQPGQETAESQDRTEGARYIGIVAGYYHPEKNGTTRTFPVPLREVRKGSVLAQETQPLDIELYLGRQGIIRPETGAQESARTQERGRK